MNLDIALMYLVIACALRNKICRVRRRSCQGDDIILSFSFTTHSTAVVGFSLFAVCI